MSRRRFSPSVAALETRALLTVALEPPLDPTGDVMAQIAAESSDMDALSAEINAYDEGANNTQVVNAAVGQWSTTDAAWDQYDIQEALELIQTKQQTLSAQYHQLGDVVRWLTDARQNARGPEVGAALDSVWGKVNSAMTQITKDMNDLGALTDWLESMREGMLTEGEQLPLAPVPPPPDPVYA